MNLQEMIQNYNNSPINYDKHDIKLSDILSDSKYATLLEFLNSCGLSYTNDIKKMSQQEYDRMKVKLPNQPGVGDIKTDIYIKKIDEIRYSNNDLYFNNGGSDNDRSQLVFSKFIGNIKTSPSYTIDMNMLKYSDGSEYLDIRKVKNDGSRKNGISIKKDCICDFLKILNDNFSEEEACNIKETDKKAEKELFEEKISDFDDMLNNLLK